MATLTGGISQVDADLTRLLTFVERQIALRLAGALRAERASVDEWRVLSLLSDGTGHAMTEIADYAMVPAPTLTKIVDRMVSANLVYRRVDDADRRRVLVFAADRGREALRRWNTAADGAMSDIEGAVGGEEIMLLRALLTRASTRLTSPPAVSGD